jgi:TRAP-type mannitol/chloroaromatic compound transport system substrate-binding protein
VKRRAFLKVGGPGVIAAAASTTLAAPAIAQGMPEIKWRLASSFPKSLDTLWGAAEHFTKRIAALTDGKFQVRPFAAGEIVPGLQVLDAVQNATVEMGHTASYYYVGKDASFAFDTDMPFGLNVRQNNAWKAHGGGRELMNEFYKTYGVTTFFAGSTGTQMGGWFRKEIKTVDDLKGLKFRIGGFAGQVMSKLGVVPQQIAGGDIYPALEKGTIDAAEWVGPYDDQKLGFNKVAPFYYYPGWWEGSGSGCMMVGLKAWETLPTAYKAAIETASAELASWVVAKYDAGNPAALRQLIAGGTQLRAFPRPVMEACMKAAFELYDETAAKNANFKKIYEPWKAFRDEQYLWFRVAEQTLDNFNFTAKS